MTDRNASDIVSLMDEDEPDGTESEAPPEPVSGSLAWWGIQRERPIEELRSDPEIQMQLYRLATEAGVLNTGLPITLELTLIQRVYGIKPDDLKDMSVLELIQLQNNLNEREKQYKNSFTKYRHSTSKWVDTGIGFPTPHEVPYNPGWFHILVQRWLNSDLQTQSQRRGGRKKT